MLFKNKHPSLFDLKERFHRTYGQLRTPLMLCSGLEVIAVNGTLSDLVKVEPDFFTNLLIGDLLINKTDEELIFEANSVPLEVQLQTPTDGNIKTCSVTAQKWELHPQLWLLEWIDLAEAKLSQKRFHRTQQYDQSIDVLLPAAFDRLVAKKLTCLEIENRHGLLISINLPQQLPHQSCIHEVSGELVENIKSQFGVDTLLGRSDTANIVIFCPVSNNHEENRFILNQLRRICRQLVPDFRLNMCSFPADGKTIADLQATLSLTEQSPSTGGNIVVYEQELASAESKRILLSSDMKDAISSNQIQPYYQPVIHSKTGHIKGFEALIRWNHPECGFVPPPQIISIATETGLLEDLTNRTLTTTLEQMRYWPDNVQFAVNISPGQICADLVDTVRQSVRRAKIDPARLEIEITEDALIDEFEFSANIFARLRAIGVSIAMDDFGSGYTSVGNLRKLKFTKIKIDKIISDGLPHDPRSIAIVRSLMFMAQEIGVDITVEGIEFEEQLEFLRAFDCGIQGYVFSPPVPIDAMQDFKKFLAPPDTSKNSPNIVKIKTRSMQIAAKSL